MSLPLGLPLSLLKDWRRYELPRSLEAYADWLRANPAPAVKPAGAHNASLLHWLAMPAPNCSGWGHPKYRANCKDFLATDGAFFDIDGKAATETAFAETWAALTAAGIGFVYSQSHNASAEEPRRGHIQILYASPCPAEQHASVWLALHVQVFPHVSRTQHSPVRGRNAPREGVLIHVQPGALLDWEAWHAKGPERAPLAELESPAGRVTDPTIAAAYRAHVQASPEDGPGNDGMTFILALAGVREYALDHSIVFAVLKEYTQRSAKPWPDDVLAKKIDDAEHSGQKRWGNALPSEWCDWLGVEPPAHAGSAAARGWPFPPGYVAPVAPAPAAAPATAPAAVEAYATYSRDAALALMNSQHRVLTSVGGSGKVRVLSWNGTLPVLQSFDDFKNRYMAQRVRIEGVVGEDGSLKPVAIAPWWLSNPQRAEALSLTFAPWTTNEIVDGRLNLWRGFGVVPKTGMWPLMRALIRDVIASGVEEHDSYVMRWLAWCVQNPGKRAEVVLVLRGKKGTGKNTLLDAYCALFGHHAKTVSNPRHLTGNFNAHLQDCALLFANEAIPPNDKAAESVLKVLVTDPIIMIERKGLDAEPAANCLSIVMASNESWCVPAGLDERRFAVFDVSDVHKQDTNYFAAIHAELDAGGREAFLADLIALPLEGWHPRQDVPKTEALAEQQLEGLRGAQRVIYHMLASGHNAGAVGGIQSDNGHVFCSTINLTEFARKGSWSGANARALGLELKAAFGARAADRELTGSGSKVRGYWLPPLGKARAMWAKHYGLSPVWDDSDCWV